MRRLTFALVLSLLAACSSESAQSGTGGTNAGGQAGTKAGGSGGTSAGASGAAGDSTEPCLGDLAELGQACLPSFDGTPAQLPPCDTLLPVANSYWIYHCGDTISYELGSGFSSLVCSYDPSSHALVGVLEGSDTTVYCKSTSFTIQAGKVPEASCQGKGTNETACGAAGAAGADGNPVK